MPSPGAISNSESQLLAEWKKIHKGELCDTKLQLDSNMEQLFETLAEWNTYLKNHVPYFQEPK